MGEALISGKLDAIFYFLVPSQETGVWMRAAPDGDHFCANQGSQMHVGRVHAEHHVELAHQGKLALQTMLALGGFYMIVFGTQSFNLLVLFSSASEKENGCVSPFVQSSDDLFHFVQRIGFGFVFGEGRNAHTGLTSCFLCLAKRGVIKFGEFWFNWEPQLLQNLILATFFRRRQPSVRSHQVRSTS